MANRRSHLILVAVLLAGLLGVVALAMPGSPMHKKTTLGLDLQGGLEVVLKAVPPKGYKLKAEDLDRSVSIMRQRVDRLGVSEPEIRKQGKDQIVIELAGVHDIKKAAAIIGKTAQLEFYDLEADLVSPSRDARGNPIASNSLYTLLAGQQALAKEGTPTGYVLFDKNKKPVVGPEDTRQKVLDNYKGKVPKGYKLFKVPQSRIVIFCPSVNGCPGQTTTTPGVTYYYLFKYDPHNAQDPIPELTGAQLKLSDIRADISTSGQGNVVRLGFNGKGNKKFHEITKLEASRGRIQSSFQHFAIVLDRELKSTPYIDYKQNPDGIDPTGTGAEISSIRTLGEAKDLALVLQTGALPVEFAQIERTDVSATLGKDSLAQAKRAALVGLLIVALFLLVLYRFLGVVAVIGLAIYAAFLYAAILLFHVTLTLPGFAGLILTIGVAADANVVIFERIKEEVRAGKSVRAAIAAGYSKGFHTIIDANVVTVITAMVLFAVATAGVKGFALMLMIGTVISMITAIAATRAMLGLLAGFRWFDNPRFMGAHGQQTAKWLQIDFMRKRYLWFAISGLIVVVSVASLATRGLNLGIDFKGGTQITFKTTQPVSLSAVRTEAGKIGKIPVVQGRGKQFGGESYENFQLRTKSLARTEQDKLTSDLKDRFGQDISLGVKNVSASFGRQIARAAIQAILFSLLLIVLYIAVRFDFKFALPVIVALLHDLAITIGIYSLTGREVSNSTVAAVLTVLGYSIYDTIIIFDRVRENIPLMRRSPFATIANVSIWETIRRSLATTFITLLPVGSLLLFGGATLKDFAFALMIGIASGAYSSIFIAAPLLTAWKEREPEYARRKGQEGLGPEAPEDGGTPAKRPRRPRIGGPAADAGTLALEEATQAAAAQEAPSLADLAPQPAAQAKRERRRQRRRARPHGRAR